MIQVLVWPKLNFKFNKCIVSLSSLWTQYDFEDSDGVTSEGKYVSIYTRIKGHSRRDFNSSL